MGLSTASTDPSSNELRTDFLGRQVVLTPARAGRPHNFAAAPPQKKLAPADCVFCPGNEHKTPPEIDRIETGAADRPTPAAPKPAGAQASAWSCRVFPNQFPAFSKSFPKAYGAHEILVETPRHEQTLSQLSDGQLTQYLSLIVRRLRAHGRDKKIKSTIVFKNQWADAGASMEHDHTQLIGLPIVPAALKRQEKVCKSSCPFCLLGIDDHYEKISSSGPFLLLTPYAPRFNHETWIVPKAHTPSLTALDEQGLADLAKALGLALRAQDAALNYPAYNLLFHLAPHGQKNFHFHLELCPRTAQWAGFEHGAEVVMNSIRPEWTAQEYKSQVTR